MRNQAVIFIRLIAPGFQKYRSKCKEEKLEEEQLRKFKGLSERFSLIPLDGMGKKPLEVGWSKWCTEKRPFNPDDFIGRNAGIPTGPANGTVVLDIDDRNEFDRLKKENGWSLPDTFTVRSGNNGHHYYYRYPDDGQKYHSSQYNVNDPSDPEGKKKIRVFDALAIGSQVVAPGSIHPDTHQEYVVEHDREIVPAPDWFIGFLKIKSDHDQPKSPNISSLSELSIMPVEIDSLPISKEKKALILNGMPIGSRSQAIMGVVDALVEAKLEEAIIYSIFEQYPIGEKYREKGADRYPWLQAHIIKARDFVKTLPNTLPQEGPIFDSADRAVKYFNGKHAVVRINGKTAILTESVNENESRTDVEFSSASDFGVFYRNRKIILHSDDNVRFISATEAWLEHKERRTYERIVFKPVGFNQNSGCNQNFYNLWRGFAVEPREGDCSLYLDHIHEVICNGDDSVNRYVLAWMADAVQHPEVKPGTSLVARGGQGTGKGVWVKYFGSLFGQHYVHVSQSRHLTGNFNAHLMGCLILFADEAHWAGDKAAEGTLKALVTEEEIMIEMKGKDALGMPNMVRIIMASNNDWVIPAGTDERRFCVLDVSNKYQGNREYFDRLTQHMEREGGREALFHFLGNYDYSGIDLRTIPRTDGLMEQKLESLDVYGKFWFDCLDNGQLMSEHNGWRMDGARISTQQNSMIISARRCREIATYHQ